MSEALKRRSLFLRKSIEQIQFESDSQLLKRSLSRYNLLFLGIGCIIGAGIYVMTGTAAANYAGPAVILSFVLAFFACVFAGLCYAELASAMPVAGSAYTYSYVSLGELAAWGTGWLLILEYGVAASTVAVGWSSNVVSLLADFGLNPSPNWTRSFLQALRGADGATSFASNNSLNLLAAGGIVAISVLLVVGISESARVNNVIVAIKVGVLLLFVGVGAWFLLGHPAQAADNWTPFVPPNEGGFKYGIAGIFRAASVIFFAYLGFEAVSTAGAEARDPQRDLPFGILGSLVVCTILYMLVAAVLTGLVNYRQLGVAAPIALAVDRIGMGWFSVLIKVGAVAGLTSVMLILTYGQTRVFYAMARDGLLPRLFCTLHPKFKTPWIGTLALGASIAVIAAVLPIEILGDLVSLGTASAFLIVCVNVLWLRKTRPDLHRPFKAPGGNLTPCLGIVFSLVMIAPFLLDIATKATRGDPIPAFLLGGYVLVGALIYAVYGYRNSHLARGLAQAKYEASGPQPMEAIAHGLVEKKRAD